MRPQFTSECKHWFNINLTSYEEFHVVIFQGATWVSLHGPDRLWSGLCSWYYWWWFLLGPRLDNCGPLPPRLGDGDGVTAPAMGTEFLLSLLLGLSCRRVWLRLFQHHITLFGFIWNNKVVKLGKWVWCLYACLIIWNKHRTKQNNTYAAEDIIH